jgi:uncharacterized protein (DUF4415 family)
MIKKETVTYTDAPPDVAEAIARSVIIEDLLPSPEELAKSLKKQRVTIYLDWDSVNFFKEEAAKNDIKYQTMINGVIRSYVQASKSKNAF